MLTNKIILFLSYLLLMTISLSCRKDLDITEFSDDFSNYNSEPRIEALILPFENTAIVRIDRSILINEESLYDCQDNDGDWDIETDDIGSDGRISEDKNGDGDFKDILEGDIAPDEDGSENNGAPDCNEPNVDEYDEILPQIHISDCIVKMYEIIGEDTTSCELNYSPTGGNFFSAEGSRNNLPTTEEIELIEYGAYTPDSNQCNINWNNFNSNYSFEVDCRDNGIYNSLIHPTQPIKLSQPVVYINENDSLEIINCSDYSCLLNSSSIYNADEGIYDTLYFAKYDTLQSIKYVSFDSITDFQLVQYMLIDGNQDGIKEQSKYYHGHPDRATELNNNIAVMNEAIVTSLYDGSGDGIGDVDTYYYKIFTFSESYSNYYFFDVLDLIDPSRTNLRDQNGNPIMGAFGSMSASIIYFRIIDCFVQNEDSCDDQNITHSVCEWYDEKWVDLNDDGQEDQNEVLPICWPK
jgi:hypothetical protein